MMINEIVVLGQIPGTDIQITFNELIGFFCICYLFSEYLKYALEIESWRRWAWRRAGVRYRRHRRHFRSVIKYKRNRLAVFERRIIRIAALKIRQRRRAVLRTAIYKPHSSLKRHYYIKLVQLERTERRVRRSRAVRTFAGWKEIVSQSG